MNGNFSNETLLKEALFNETRLDGTLLIESRLTGMAP
jgi:hypothetical protein